MVGGGGVDGREGKNEIKMWGQGKRGKERWRKSHNNGVKSKLHLPGL